MIDAGPAGEAIAAAQGLVITRGRAIPGDGPKTVADVLDRWVATEPDRPALIDRVETLSYGALDDLVDRAAAALAASGIGVGDRVAASLPNCNDLVVLFLATMRVGGIWMGINRVLAGPEKRYLLADGGAAVFLGDPDTAEQVRGLHADLSDLRDVITVDPCDPDSTWRRHLAGCTPQRPAIEIDPFGPAAIAYTSGTTGFPKGAVHSQHNMLLPGAVSISGAGIPSERQAVVLPLTILNLVILGPLISFQRGGTCLPVDRIDTIGIVERVRRDRIDGFSATPVIVYDLLTNPEVDQADLASLTGLGVGGASAPPGLHERYIERFGRDFGMGYGLTEAPTAVTITNPEQPGPPGNTGRALPQVRVRIVDEAGVEVPADTEGEVVVAPADEGHFAGVYTPMLGYWGKPEATAAALHDGWLHTGDIGYLSDDASLFIIDRRNDLIQRGGANVYPAEVERVILGHPEIAEASVIGRPDERLGETVVAFVQLVPEATVTVEELAERCRTELARYKVPAEWHVLDAFPRNSMGKVVKPELRKLLDTP